MEQVLPLDSIEFDLSVERTGDISNMSAEQYLSWVRYQADHLPDVKRANLDHSKIPNRQSKYMPQVDSILQCPPELLPSEEWQREILYAFSELRMTIERLSVEDGSKDRKVAVPQMKDEDAWHRFCLDFEIEQDVTNCNTIVAGNNSNESEAAIVRRKQKLVKQLFRISSVESSTENELDLLEPSDNMDFNNEENNENNCEIFEEDCEDAIEEAIAEAAALAHAQAAWSGAINVEPNVAILLQFDQVLTQRLLTMHINWLEQRRHLTTARAQWLYGLLARLEKPVYRETAASLRQLYRRCCNLRYHLNTTNNNSIDNSNNEESASFNAYNNDSNYQSKTNDISNEFITATTTFNDDNNNNIETNSSTELAALNILISITGSYFGQGEEYDEFNSTHVMDHEEDEDDDEEEEDANSEEVECSGSDDDYHCNEVDEEDEENVDMMMDGAGNQELEDGEEPEECSNFYIDSCESSLGKKNFRSKTVLKAKKTRTN